MTYEEMTNTCIELDKRLGKESEKYPGGTQRMFEVEKAALDELRTSGNYIKMDGKLISDIALEMPPDNRFDFCLNIGDCLCDFGIMARDRYIVDIKLANLFPACILLRTIVIIEEAGRFRASEDEERELECHYEIEEGEPDNLKAMFSALDVFYPWLKVSFYPQTVAKERNEKTNENKQFTVTAGLEVDGIGTIDVGRVGVRGKVIKGTITKESLVYFAARSGKEHRLLGVIGRIMHIWKNGEETEYLSEGEEAEFMLAMDFPKGRYTGLIMVQGEFS